MKLYKVLTKTGRSPYADYPYPLPDGDKPGEWLPAIDGAIEMCSTGYHLCREQDLVHWLNARIFEVEVEQDGKVVAWNDKVGTVAPIRLLRELTTWNKKTQRLFACDCAEHALHMFENKYPDDKRPREAIEVARRFALGKATIDELRSASNAAADAVVDAAATYTYTAYAAANAAADAATAYAYTAYAYAAADAAADAATAANAAAYAAADAAKERQRQTKRLMSILYED